MLTFYSVVKGFVGNTTYLQRNAIRSWKKAVPDCEIILFGDDEPNAQQEAMDMHLHVLPMERTEHGAPLLPYIVGKANEIARYDIRCLINADIILDSRFSQAVDVVSMNLDSFLMIAQRHGVEVDGEIDFSDEDWFVWMYQNRVKPGNLSAIDFFCYRGDWLKDIPPFGIGRCSWDNWLVHKAATEGVPIVNATMMTMAWHQDHPKHKIPVEWQENRELLGDWKPTWGSLLEATYILGGNGMLMESGTSRIMEKTRTDL